MVEAEYVLRDTDSIVCTLYEGSYYFGVAALVNSLIDQGFAGVIVAGYKGSLPPWVSQLQLGDRPFEYRLSDDAFLQFIFLETKIHLTNFKPSFLKTLLEQNPQGRYVAYFDPDITLRCGWSFYRAWLSHGVALCEDITNGTMPKNHPIRLMWTAFAKQEGLHSPKELDRYYNAGFVGVAHSSRTFLDLWQFILLRSAHAGCNLHGFLVGKRTDLFYGADQDALNIAAMYTDAPLSTIGPEGMALVPGGFTMYHALGAPKPWRKGFIASALLGSPPTGADKAYLRFSSGPIHSYRPLTLVWKKVTCAVASFVGRFYSRR